MLMGNFGSEKVDQDMVDAIDFMVEKVINSIIVSVQSIYRQ